MTMTAKKLENQALALVNRFGQCYSMRKALKIKCEAKRLLPLVVACGEDGRTAHFWLSTMFNRIDIFVNSARRAKLESLFAEYVKRHGPLSMSYGDWLECSKQGLDLQKKWGWA